MVDWKKEISLPDLSGRKREPQSEPQPELQSEPEPAPEPAPERAAGPWWPTGELSGVEPEPLEPDETEEKPPFWKRELSFGRRSRRTREEEFEIDDLEAELQLDPDEIEKSRPFWKRGLALGRRSGRTREEEFQVDDAPFAAAELQLDPDETEKPRPFWKRGLSRGRRPKAPEDAGERKRRLFGRKEKPEADTDAEPRQRRRPAPSRPGLPRPSGGKRLVGLKIGASQLAAATVANNGSAQVLQLAREPLAPGIVSAGELHDPDALAEALKEFFARHKLPRRSVRLGLATSRLGVRSFEIADIEDPKRLANAVRFRAQEVLPIPIEEAVLDYRVLRERVDEEGSTRRDVLIVVAYRDLVDRYVDACRKAGIRLAGIDLEAFALLRAVGTQPDRAHADAAVVVVAIGYDRTTFAVSDGSTCEFTRVLEWGGSALDVAVARILHLTPSAAEPVKRMLSLVDEEVPEGLSPEQAALAREAMRAELGAFARQLVSSLQFYQSQPGSLSIGSLRVTGGTSHLPGLASELSRIIGADVEVADPLASVEVSRKVREVEQPGSLAIAIGLGIGA